MNKIFKKITTVLVSTAMLVGACAFSGCNTVLKGDISGDVVSNSGFVVEKGNYVYFINGVEEYTASNKMGDVVKASLVRLAKSDLSAGNYEAAEVVVPTLVVAGDYEEAGVFIYGDYVYYATPTNVKDVSTGTVQNSYLDFKSCKLDGTERMSDSLYFRADSNTVDYRYVEVDGVVYCMHVDVQDIYAYNTETGVDTLIARNTVDYAFSEDATNPSVYYTMEVVVDAHSEHAYEEAYNQLYTARADVTEETAPQQYVDYKATLAEKEEEDGTDIYHNLGTLVLDGRGSNNVLTMLNWEQTAQPTTPGGYSYDLVTYANGGLYYIRDNVNTTSSAQDGGWLFYLADEKVADASFNSVTSNADTALADAGEYHDVVAYNTDNANEDALFIYEEGNHGYVYVDGNDIYVARVAEAASGIETTETRIAASASGAELLYTDNSDAEYDYVYYATEAGNGKALNRAVYNGSANDYSNILANKDYQPVRILKIDYVSDWYAPEIVSYNGEHYLFFVNAEAIGSSSYNYVSVMSLNGANGMMTNSEIVALNEKYNEINDFISEQTNEHDELGDAMYYYYMTGETELFYAAIETAVEEGYTNTYHYSEYYQQQFADFTTQSGEYAEKFKDENGEYYSVQSYFYATAGIVSEEDAEALENVWENGYILSLDEEEEGLPVWAWILIGVGSAAIVAGIVLAIVLSVSKKKKKQAMAMAAAAEEEKNEPVIILDGDDDIDVYAVEEETAENSEE